MDPTSSPTIDAESLLDFIPLISPHWERPVHLQKIAELFTRAEREEVRALVSVPPQHGKPLHVDTPVTMADGSRRPIGSLHVGDLVVSGFGRVTAVTAVYRQGVLPTLNIRMRSGRVIRAEGSHRFLTQRGWVRADELKPYSRTTSDRPRGDMLVAPSDYEQEQASALTGIEARFLGYLIGDGNTTQRNIRFTSVDPEVRALFKQCVEALGGTTADDDEQTIRVRGDARKVVRKHGLVGKTAHTKRVPEAVWTASAEALEHFLAAYFECDGTRVRKFNGRLGAGTSFSSVSRELLEDVRSLLSRLGIHSALSQKRGRYKGQEHISWRLTVRDDVRFFRRLPIVGKKAGPSSLTRHKDVDGPRHDQVVAVEQAEPAECVCITVADDESFLANDLVTHNTETILHGIAWLLRRHREWTIGYTSYSSDIAKSKSRSARDYAKRSGTLLREDSTSVSEWRTKEGGGLLARGIGGGLTSMGLQVLIIDDPHKDRADAESALSRQRVFDWYTSTARTRVHPGGSIIVCHCIARDEPVLIAGGSWLPIQDVPVGELVRAYENGQWVSRKVLGNKSSGIDKVFVVRTEGLSVRANDRHPFLLESGEWCQTKNLSVGARVRTINGVQAITAIEPDGEEEVFDLMVDGAENFVAGGFVVHNTRWHVDDLIGRLSQEVDENGRPIWEYINLPAINEEGQALWHKRPVDYLLKAKAASEYDWASLYMGEPRPRGLSVFRGVRYYDRLPIRFRIGKGCDLAYTAKTKADFSVGIVMLAEHDGPNANYYIIDVVRDQAEIPDFAKRLQVIDADWPGSWHWFCSTTEKGVAQLMTDKGVYVDPVVATTDKFVRAQAVATAWNEGRVLVPKSAPWLKPFVDEILAFSGKGDRKDDQVDALASAFASVAGFSDPARTADKQLYRYADFGTYGRG